MDQSKLNINYAGLASAQLRHMDHAVEPGKRSRPDFTAEGLTQPLAAKERNTWLNFIGRRTLRGQDQAIGDAGTYRPVPIDGLHSPEKVGLVLLRTAPVLPQYQ